MLRTTQLGLWIGAMGFVCAMLLGCGDTDEEDSANNGTSNGTTATSNSTTAAPDEWFACEAASDCVTFEAECCDHCNGGRMVSVNATFETMATAALKTGQCDAIDCTLVTCADEVPTCEAGVCGSMPDPNFGN